MKRNACFQLVQKEDGMYLKSYPAADGGKSLEIDDILSYLGAKKYDSVTVDMVRSFVLDADKQKHAELQISFQQELPEKEFAVISIDQERTYAKIRLYPNSNKGERLTQSDVEDLLAQKGVVHGIIKKNIEIMLKARLYCTDVLVAKATPPVQGYDAEITYHFDVDKTNKPEMSSDGQVDFHKLDMIEPVKEGQLLATLLPAKQGTPGTDVTGNPIKPRTVIVKKLKHGKNIHLSEDECEMYSEVAGNVTCVNETVFVSDCYEVPADVGPSTGDIDYDGSVRVKGNVLTGYAIHAAGDIYVNGVVEGATLTADGKIVLNRGIQGMGKAVLEAKGDIITNFIESAQVKSGGKIMTDAIMHSDVLAKEEVDVNGKRGLIAGGKVRSSIKIEAKVLGSTMGTQTELEVGYDPMLIERYHAIEEQMESMSDEKSILEQNVEILKKRYKAVGSLEKEKLVQLKTSVSRMEEIEQEMEKLTEEYEQLDEELEKMTGRGKITVMDVAYSGVKLTISNVTKYLHNEVQHSTFVREGADIRIRGV